MPKRWGLDWQRVRVSVCGETLTKDATEHERIGRLIRNRNHIIAFARQWGCRIAVVEEYAFNARGSQAHSLGENGGVVKVALIDSGIDVFTASPRSAIQLLGKQPRKDSKEWAHKQLLAAGAPAWWTGDQLDAFIIANHHLSQTGGDALMIPA